MLASIILIAIFIAILLFLKSLKKKKKNFNYRVLTALVIGLVFGLIIQLGFGTEQSQNIDVNGNVVDSENITYFADLQISEEQLIIDYGKEAPKYDGVVANESTSQPTFINQKNTASGNLMIFMSIFSGIYLSLLKLVVIPLIFISITTAIINARGKANLGKKVTKVIGLLLVTVSIAAVVGVATSLIIGIDGQQLVNGYAQNADVLDRASSLSEKSSELTSMNFADLILAPIPSDFSFLVGAGSSAALTTVLFGMFLGYCILQVDKRKPEKVSLFIDILNTTKEVVLSMVREILKLTPFAIVALMATFMATTSFSGMSQLVLFVIGTYVAIIVMYIIHLIMLALFGLNPVKFAKKTYPVLVFGFGSRSSMAALTLNTATQQKQLGVDPMSSDLAATFGVTIGQNGCAGIYPAMVAVMAMQAYGGDITLGWILLLVVVIAISSFGIAGVGGGASFAAIAVLSILGLPVTMAAILISVEPLLDMARTALNISDGMLVGTLVSKIDGELDIDTYNSDQISLEDTENTQFDGE